MPVGAIPYAVQTAHASSKPRGRASVPAPGVRPLAHGETITSERLAGIVRDVVLGVVRNTDDEDEEAARPRRLDRVDRDLNRLAAFMFRRFLTTLFKAKEEGRKGIGFVGGWRNVGNMTLRVFVGLPVAAFLTVRALTGDIWPVRRLPALAAGGWILWDPMGLDKLIRDQVLARLPMYEIASFTSAYFSQAASTGAWCLAGMALLVALFGYSIEAERAVKEQRAEKNTDRKKAKAAQLSGNSPRTQGSSAEVAAAAAALASVDVKTLLAMPPTPLVANLARSVPHQTTDQKLAVPPVLPRSTR